MMELSFDKAWAEQALAALQEAGYRRGGARKTVVEALARHECAVTALELDDELRGRDAGVARASIYRSLEQLEELGLLRRMEVVRGMASYERVVSNGHHHHHAICRRCGRLEPFEDAGLERAISRVAGKVDVDVSEHEVVLRGICERCAA